MKQQFFILLFSVSIFSSCNLLENNISTGIPFDNCQTDTLNIPPIDILWEQDLNLNEAQVFSPIIYKDFVLVGKEKTLSFFNKETGVLEKTLDVTLPVPGGSNEDVHEILQGNCFVKGEYLVFQRYLPTSGSYEYGTLLTELLNLETGVVSQLDESEVGFDNEPINQNSRINLFGDNYLKYEYESSNNTNKVKLLNIFDGTETTISTAGSAFIRGNNIWESSTGDTLIAFATSGFGTTELQAFNISKNKTDINFNLEIRSSNRRLLRIKDDVIYLRGKTQLIAIDALSRSTLWEKSDLNGLYVDAASLYRHNLHITDKHVIDISRGTLSVFDKDTGELIFEQTRMPDTVVNTRTVISNDELIVIGNGILRIDLNNGCVIWQTNEPSDNQDFSGIITQDETLNRLYSIKNGKLVCIQL
jgi:hypothetical protein